MNTVCKNMLGTEKKTAPGVRKNPERRPWAVALEIEPGMPENQSLIFAVIMLKHASMLATLRDQMSLARASMQPAAQQAKPHFRQRAAAICALFRVPTGRPTFAQRPNSPGSCPMRPYGQFWSGCYCQCYVSPLSLLLLAKKMIHGFLPHRTQVNLSKRCAWSPHHSTLKRYYACRTYTHASVYIVYWEAWRAGSRAASF